MPEAFGILTLATLGGALGVVLATDVVHSAYFLVLAFLGVAGYYFLLGGEFVGAVQLLIYAGAVAVLFLFAVMLTRRRADPVWGRSPARWLGVGGAAALLAWLLLTHLERHPWPTKLPPPAPHNTALIGKALFRPFVVPFEVVSVLLLAALVGALLLARKEGGAS